MLYYLANLINLTEYKNIKKAGNRSPDHLP